MVRAILAVLIPCLTGLWSAANAHARSDLPERFTMIEGTKHPNRADEGIESVTTRAATLSTYNGFNKLLPYVLGSPVQEGAGSCLYMTLTGVAEWWLAKRQPSQSRAIDGPIDLSERYFMNIAGVHEDESGVTNWKLDSMQHLNRAGGSMLNRDYRYTKGWYKEVDDEEMPYVESSKDDEGSKYGTEFNWIDHRDRITKPQVELPHFDRRVLFADPASNQWNVAVAPDDIVNQVKKALRKHRSPINVIYNHYGYWHAVMIVGFDDQITDHGCSFTDGSGPYLKKKSIEYAAQAEDLTGEAKEKMVKRAQRYKTLAAKLNAAYEQGGGCKNRGVFYVRDSLYNDANGPAYDYDLAKEGEERPLGKRVILREYEWLRYLSNHVIQVFPTDQS